MDFIQQIKLKDVAANNDAILFKVSVNGEDRVFVGKQNTRFDIEVANNLESQLLSDKLSANLKLVESFQKAYIVDRGVMHKENYKKDVIIPCAVSKEIVQLGDLLYSLSTETNNNVLYLLYKNRLINRYVDDVTHMIYYELNDEVKSYVEDLEPDEILQGPKSANNVFKGLIDNFNINVLISRDNDTYVKDGSIDTIAIEKTAKYTNMDGLNEAIEDFLNVTNKDYEMPFNLIYEYGEDRQYENEQSNIYTDFIHLKNSLSPFFNVEVVDDIENKFKLWRKYVKVSSSNFKLWTSYTLETPKLLNYEVDKNVSVLNVGNNSGNSKDGEYYNDIEIFAKTEPDFRLNEDLKRDGFSINLNCSKYQLTSRYMFSFNNRAAAAKNDDQNYLTQTSQDFANWLIEKSNGRIQYKIVSSTGASVYPRNTEFTINVIRSLDGNDTIIELECIKDLNTSNFDITEKLDHLIPPYVNVFNFNYDKGQIYRRGYDSFIDFKKTPLETKTIKYSELNEYTGEPEQKEITGTVYKWDNLENNSDCYKFDSFSLKYCNGNTDTFIKKTIYDYNNPEISKSVNSKDFVKKTMWSMSLIGDIEQFKWIEDALYNEGYKVETTHGYFFEKLSPEEWEKLSNGDITKNDILNAKISERGYVSLEIWNALSTETKIKYLLTKLLKNFNSSLGDPTAEIVCENFKNIKNVFLCEQVGSTLSDAVACLFYHINKNNTWKIGDKIRFINYRLSQYETRLAETDSASNENQYYLNSASGPSIKYFAIPFDIRFAIDSQNVADQPLTAPNYNNSLIDLFGITINGKYVKDYDILESNIVSFLLRDKSSVATVNLIVTFKNEYGDDALCVKSYINGQLVNSSEYDTLSREYIELSDRLKTIKHLRFWCYGENGYLNKEFEGTCPFKYNNISMWNYPLSLAQCQQLRRLTLAKQSLKNAINDFYKSINSMSLEIVDKDTEETGLCGKLFNIDTQYLNFDYAFDNKPGVTENNKKLFKVQDFEFIDRINGLNKLTPTSGRKSNLYSVKISNTGLAIEEDDDNETKNFKQTMNSALVAAVNTICSKTEPLNTKLYSVIIDS